MSSYWLIVERYENWKIDKSEGFSQFGVKKNKQNLVEQIVPGDFLITYVSSGKSCFSDIRIVENPVLKKLGVDGNYDTAFPIAISTKPSIVLDEEKWIHISKLAPQCSFGKDGVWQPFVMQVSIKPLSLSDGKVIHNAIKLSKGE